MVLNNEEKKERIRKKDEIFSEEVKSRQERRIRNVLNRALNKKVLISNTTFDEFDDNIGEVLEGNLDYDVDRLVNYFLDIIKMCGSFVKVSNGTRLEGRTILLDREIKKNNIGVQENNEREITYYNYYVYPEVIESFLNDLENIDNGYDAINNNSILVDFEDKRKYAEYIDFSNCYNIDLSNLTNYVILKYLFSLIKVKNVKNYSNKDSVLSDRIIYNDIMLGCLKKVSTINEASFIKNNNKVKGKIKTKKINE